LIAWEDTFNMHRVLWIVSFGIAAPAAISASFLLLLSISSQTASPTKISRPVLSAYTQVYESQPAFGTQISIEVVTSDARPLLVKNYLSRYSSPLVPFFEEIVKVSDKYNLDFRLLVAIAQQESNLCKKIPPNSHNCWGFGIYGEKVTRFDSYPQALETVAKTLKSQYIDKGLDTPEKIMVKYTPPSVALGGPWAKGVNQFMGEME
jgi:hypothetical protein